MTTTKKPAAAAAQAVTETVTVEARPDRTPTRAVAVVGPAPGIGVKPVTVKLSHHLAINGKDYPPGAEILVSPDYARRLRAQGYTART